MLPLFRGCSYERHPEKRIRFVSDRGSDIHKAADGQGRAADTNDHTRTGERAEYKIPCDCRKPKPGMLLAAAEKYNLDLAESWMIGDSGRDVQAGQAAGCRTALIGEGEYGQDATCASLLEFAHSLT